LLVVVLLALSLILVKRPWWPSDSKKNIVERDLTANGSDNPIMGAVISPDGRQLAYYDPRNKLSLLQVDTGEKRNFPNSTDMAPQGWFPDGTHLLVGPAAPGGLWKMSTLDGSTRKLLDPSLGVAEVSLSPDGREIAFNKASKMGELWITEADGEDPHAVLSIEPSKIYALAWSPTSQRVAYVRFGEKVTSIESCDRKGGQRRLILSEKNLQGADGLSDVSWSADGRLFYRLIKPAPNGDSKSIWSIEVDPDTGRVRGRSSQVTAWTVLSQRNFSQSADGKRLAFVNTRSQDTVQVAEIRPGGTGLGAPSPLTGDNWNKWLEEWTGDSQAIVFKSSPQGKFGIFKQDIRTHRTESLITDLYSPDAKYMLNTPVVISPDRQWLLFTQTSKDDRSGSSTRLMRMPMSGGAASVVLTGYFFYDCASQINVCVVSEVYGGRRVFSLLDPTKGRGPDIAQADPTSTHWSLSSDGKRIGFSFQVR
jgi:Tol biopolymer transport system component